MVIESNAQKPDRAIRVYGNFKYLYSGTVADYIEFDRYPFIFWDFTPSISFQNPDRRRVFEFEPRVRISKRDEGYISDKEFAIRMEWSYYLRKKLFKTIKVRWGISPRPYFYYGVKSPRNNVGYIVRKTTGGLAFSWVLHLEYDLSDRVFVDLSTSNLFLDFGLDYQFNDNPVLAERQKRQGGFDFDMGGERLLRVGMGYRLN